MSRLRANQITNENANGAPNFPHGLTVTGVVTATTSATTMSQIVVGSAVTANSQGIDVTGIVTATSFKGDGSNLTGIDSSALSSGGSVKVQANSHGAVTTGVHTATSFSGSGAGLTNLPGVTIVSATSIGTGTYKDITIDSTNVYKIEIVFYNISVSGNTDFGFRLMSSGGASGSGYKAAAAYFSNASYAGNNMRTDSFRWTGLAGASNVVNGRIVFYNHDANIYYAEGIAMKSDGSDATQYFITGIKDLGSTLTGIRIIASYNLSRNFDGGTYKVITHTS